MTSSLHHSVLLVDDDFAVASMYALGLQHAGMSVTTAANGRAALAAIGREVPEIAIVDWNLPGMSGNDLLWLLRRDVRTMRLPVVFLSVYEPDEERALTLRADDRSEWLMKTRTTPRQLAAHVLTTLNEVAALRTPEAIA